MFVFRFSNFFLTSLKHVLMMLELLNYSDRRKFSGLQRTVLTTTDKKRRKNMAKNLNFTQKDAVYHGDFKTHNIV